MQKYGVVRSDQPREDWENEGGNPDPLERITSSLPDEDKEKEQDSKE